MDKDSVQWEAKWYFITFFKSVCLKQSWDNKKVTDNKNVFLLSKILRNVYVKRLTKNRHIFINNILSVSPYSISSADYMTMLRMSIYSIQKVVTRSFMTAISNSLSNKFDFKHQQLI